MNLNTLLQPDAIPHTGWEPLDKLSEELADLRAQRVEAQQTLQRLRTVDARQAAQADRDARAALIRDGKDTTARPQSEKVARDIADTEAKVEAISRAIELVGEEVVKLCETEGAAFQAKLADRERKSRQRYTEAVAQLAEHRHDAHIASAVARWVESAKNGNLSRLSVGTGNLGHLKGANGDPIGFDQVLAALQADAAGEPVQKKVYLHGVHCGVA